MSFAEWVKQNHAQGPSLAGQLQAMAREAATDAHAALMQSYFGQQPGPSAPGTPLSPTQAEVNQDLGNVRGYQQQLDGLAARAPPRRRSRGASRGDESPFPRARRVAGPGEGRV